MPLNQIRERKGSNFNSIAKLKSWPRILFRGPKNLKKIYISNICPIAATVYGSHRRSLILCLKLNKESFIELPFSIINVPYKLLFFVHELVRPVALYILCTVQCISGVIIRFQNFMLGKCILVHKGIDYNYYSSALQRALVVIKVHVTKHSFV